MQGQPINNEALINLFNYADFLIRVGIILTILAIDYTIGAWTKTHIPDITKLLNHIGFSLKQRLDKPSRSKQERFYRGIVISLIIISISILAGFYLNKYAFYNSATTALVLFLLIPVFAQRLYWKTLKASIETNQSTSKISENMKRSFLSFSTEIVPYCIAFIIGGFIMFLPILLLSSLLFTTHDTNADRPYSIYSVGISTVRELIVFPFSVFASFFIYLSFIFVPFTKLSAAKQLFPSATKGLPSAYFPLNIACTGLDINFRIQGSKSVEWIGPKEGRARLQAEQIRRGWLCILVANAIFFFAGILFLFFTASRLIN